MRPLIFLHGLNTYGDDDLHIGPMRFGEMHMHLEREFRARGVEFISVTGLGGGSPEDQASRAIHFLQHHKLLESANTLDLLGQSVGGLVARVLESRSELRGRVRKLITIGTPHHGTRLAEFGLDFPLSYPRLHKLGAAIGYDTLKRSTSYQHLTHEAMREFNLRYPDSPSAKQLSLLCQVTDKDVSLALKPFYFRWHPLGEMYRSQPSDGFILTDSQRWGKEEGPFALDHYAMLGFFMHLSPSFRRRAQAELLRMVDFVINELKID